MDKDSAASASSSSKQAATGGGSGQQPRRVQVTAKLLFGSVSAISSMSAAERGRKKQQQ
ncbi:uncharacterized protein LOC132194485 [Neocloeon triangulifer]|uniref:uncharacterized protein LOC132194485 n=1 Tax=Neocloeon triangulifer TaxID=2078957 RepID=UPI00286EC674|nr:uncharacterized protein LOC132194485 [Neocloeon triangulifer]